MNAYAQTLPSTANPLPYQPGQPMRIETPERPVASQVKTLEDSLHLISQALSDLIIRIEPALRPVPPTDNVPILASPAPMVSPLADRLRSLVSQAQEIQYTLTRVIDRVEV